MDKPSILISGVGRIGTALAKIIAPTRQAEIALWDTDATKVSPVVTPQKLAAQADFILLCLPSTATRSFVSSIVTSLKPSTIVVSLIKGLDETTGATMPEVLLELLPDTAKPVMLGGPMLSAELLQGKFAYGVAGCDQGTFTRLAELFAPTLLRLEYCADMPGVSVVGVLKNVYALGLGIALALDVGDNARGWLVMQALTEMREVTPRLGGQADTVYTLAGIGDFVATAYSQHSRNRTVGEELVMQGTATIASEGLLTLPVLMRRLDHDAKSLPLLQLIHDVVVGGKDARRSFQRLLARGYQSRAAGPTT